MIILTNNLHRILHCIDANPVEGKNSNDKSIVAHWEAFLFAQIKPDDQDRDEDGDYGGSDVMLEHSSSL